VNAISDGRLVNKGPRGKGALIDMGYTVVLATSGMEVAVTQRRFQPSDPEARRSLGIEPTVRKIVVLKSAVNFKAAFQPIAKEITEVVGPGIGSADPITFSSIKVRPPVFPLDPLG
jgi:microcystin degradation protein MlrC